MSYLLSPFRTKLWLFAIPLLIFLQSSVAASELPGLPDLPSLRPGMTINLNDAIRQADRSNRSLKSLRVDLQSAAAKLKTSWAALLPNMYGDIAYTLNDHADTVEQDGKTYETKSKHEASLGLQASMPLIDTQRWMTIDAARAERDLTSLSVEQGRQTLLYAVATAYFQLVTLKRLLIVYDAQFSALENHLKSVKDRFRSGIGSLADVRQAETDLVSVREEQVKAIFSLEDSRDAMALLIATDIPPMPVDDQLVIPFPEALSGQEKGKPFSDNWDLKIAQQTVSLQKKQMTAQWMQFVPDVNAQWQYNYSLTDLNSAKEFERDRWFAGLVLAVPLFDYSFYPNLQEQRASLRMAKLQLEERDAEASVVTTKALRAIEKSKYLAKTAELKSKLADDALELAQLNYIHGNGSALMVIDARRNSQTAHVDLETRRFDLEITKLEYFRETGRDITQLVN